MSPLSARARAALSQVRPVLFVNIGWAARYDGTEAVVGGHGYLNHGPHKPGETFAFTPRRGFFRCGIGPGVIDSKAIHVVFVAREPGTNAMRLVGVYANAEPIQEPAPKGNAWVTARTKEAWLLSPVHRPLVLYWPGRMGMRRWARKHDGEGHLTLLAAFLTLTGQSRLLTTDPWTDSVDEGSEFLEGAEYKKYVKHRTREKRLRKAKIESVLKRTGALTCEVPGCGFDFAERFGVLGQEYAHVHHKIPLSRADVQGRKSSMADLAIVCANCHAMIHRGGRCRPLAGLIP